LGSRRFEVVGESEHSRVRRAAKRSSRRIDSFAPAG
jgi:hypothetical protein